jgi:ferredoxin
VNLQGWFVTVDRERCMGSGLCLLYAPSTFTHDDEAKAVVLESPTDDIDAVRTAVAACPVAALHLTEQGA